MDTALITRALADHTAATADYKYDIAGLQADAKILAYTQKFVQNQTSHADTDESYLALLREGTGRYAAARVLGIDPLVIFRRLRTDDEFRDRVLIAEIESLEPAYQALRTKANNGDNKALTLLMQSKNPEEFAQSPKNQVNVQVNNGSVAATTDDPIDAEILQLAADLQHKRELVEKTHDAVIEIPFGETDE